MHWILAVAMALIGLILAPGVTFYFDITPKLLVLLTAVAISWQWPQIQWRNPLLVLALLDAIVLAFCARSSLGVWGSSWRSYGAITQFAILLFALSLSTQARHALSILRVVSIAGALTAVYGIAQYLGFDPILNAAGYHIGEGVWTIVRPPSTLGYVSYFATWLLFIAFLSMAIPDRLSGAIAALCFLSVVLTGTRAAILGAITGAAVWCLWRGVRVSPRAFLATALVILAAAGLVLTPAGTPLRGRVRWFIEDPWGGARPLLWRDSLRMALDQPFAGYGLETFTASFPRYESAELASAYPDFAHESPHNIFLDAFVSQGVMGMLLLIAFCSLGFRAAWQARAKHPRTSAALASALGAGIAAQQFTVFTIPTAVMFFGVIALAMGLADPPEVVRLRIPLAFPLLLAMGHYVFVDLALAHTRHELEAGHLNAQPPPAADLWYSRALLNTSLKSYDFRERLLALQHATAAAQRATRTAEDPFNAWYNLAAFQAAQNDSSGAEESLRSAIAARPNWFKPHWTLAQLLSLEHRTAEARVEAVRAARLDGGNHAEVAATLLRLQK